MGKKLAIFTWDGHGPIALTFGPIVALRSALGERVEAFDRDFLEFATRAARTEDGRVQYPYEYLLAVARKRRD